MSRRYLGRVPLPTREVVAPAQKPATSAWFFHHGYDRGGSACHVTPLPRENRHAVYGVGVPCHAATRGGVSPADFQDLLFPTS
ncbi:MAG: hypothetical protein KGZ50_06395 [Peptococcaceae bacterium]|nr:hypothetical protein [Peptococcaceae bacterium]